MKPRAWSGARLCTAVVGLPGVANSLVSLLRRKRHASALALPHDIGASDLSTLVCEVAALSPSARARLYEDATACDRFLLIVEASASAGRLRVGPMLPPGIPAVDRPALLRIAGGGGHKLRRAPVAIGVVRQLARVVLAQAHAPSLPLIWQRLTIDSSAIRSTSVSGATHLRLRSSSAALSITRFLDPTVLENRAALARVRAALRAGRLVSVRGAFDGSFAADVHAALMATRDWQRFEHHDRFFSFRHHNLYQWRRFPPVLKTARLVFDSSATKEWITRLTGVDCAAQSVFGASWYKPGDFTLPHSDDLLGRRVAFAWHLAEGWKKEWGGGLYWGPAHVEVSPAFNTLLLFAVSKDREHFVTRVAPEARGKRLAVHGWWCDGNIVPPPKRKRATRALDRAGRFESYG